MNRSARHRPGSFFPAEAAGRPRAPAKRGVFVKPREISVSTGVRGGSGRTQTGNQTVISRSRQSPIGVINGARDCRNAGDADYVWTRLTDPMDDSVGSLAAG